MIEASLCIGAGGGTDGIRTREFVVVVPRYTPKGSGLKGGQSRLCRPTISTFLLCRRRYR